MSIHQPNELIAPRYLYVCVRLLLVACALLPGAMAAQDGVRAPDTHRGATRITRVVAAGTANDAAGMPRPLAPARQAVSVHFMSTPLRDAIDTIAARAGLAVTYTAETLPRTRRITFHADGIPAIVALERALAGTRVGVHVTPGGQVALVPRPWRRAPAVLVGRVTDADGNTLSGAYVGLVDTRRSTATDRAGRYRLADVPDGERRLIVRYLGHTPDTVRVTIRPGETTVRDVMLRATPVVLRGIVVEGQRRGQAQAINQQKTAGNVRNVAAAEEIARLPDRNVAEALQRFPGVTVQQNHGEGEQVQIRGLPPEFSSVTVDGITLPSSSGNNRGVRLSVIPSEVVAAIEIAKTLTPDMDGDAIGGTINLVTQTPREDRPFVSATASSGYSDQAGSGIQQFAGTYGNRFGARAQLGLLLGGSYYDGGRGSDDLDVQWADQTFSGTPHSVLSNLDLRDYDFVQDRRSVFGTADYRFGPQSSLYLRGAYNEYEDEAYRRRSAVRFGSGTFTSPTQVTGGRIDRDLVDNPTNQQLLFITAGGEQARGRLAADYSVSFGRARRYESDRTIAFARRGVNFTTDYSDPLRPRYSATNVADEFDPAAYTFTSATFDDVNISDRDVTAALNLSTPVAFGAAIGSVKAGAKLRAKNRTRDLESQAYDGYSGTLRLADVLGTFEDDDFFLNRYQLGRVPGLQETRSFFAANQARFRRNQTDSDIDSRSSDQAARETIWAGYAMTTLDIGRLRMIPGVRVEATGLDYVGTEVSFDTAGGYTGAAPVSGDGRYLNVLPGINLRYTLSENTNVRAAATRSLARPDFGAVAPYREVDRETQRISLGNPGLKPTRATNFDLLAEHYVGSIGVISAGAFYKRLTDYIFTRQYAFAGGPFDGYRATQPQNGANARVYGAELNWQQQLSFLPGALNGLGIFANYTFAESRAEFPNRERAATLPEQPRHVGNFALSYEKYRFSGRAAISLIGTNLTEIGDTPATDVFFDRHLEADLAASVNVTPTVRVFVELGNLIDGPRRRYRGTLDRPVEHEYYSWWTQFGVKVSR